MAERPEGPPARRVLTLRARRRYWTVIEPLIDGWKAQLKEYVAPEGILTHEYRYYSSFSTSWLAHAKSYCEMIAARRNLDASSFVVELASNDGYLLQHFPPLGVRNILGVEPSANDAAVARGKGIPVEIDFFGRALAEKIVA